MDSGRVPTAPIATPERRVIKLKLPSSDLRADSSPFASAVKRSLHSSVSSMPKLTPPNRHKQTGLRTCKECYSRERPELFLAINLINNNDYREKCFTCRRLDSVNEWYKGQRKAGFDKIPLRSQSLHIETHIDVCKKWQAKLQDRGFTIPDDYIDQVITAVSKHEALQDAAKEASHKARSAAAKAAKVKQQNSRLKALQLACLSDGADPDSTTNTESSKLLKPKIELEADQCDYEGVLKDMPKKRLANKRRVTFLDSESPDDMEIDETTTSAGALNLSETLRARQTSFGARMSSMRACPSNPGCHDAVKDLSRDSDGSFNQDRTFSSSRVVEPIFFKSRLELTAWELRRVAEMLDGAAHLTDEAADWVLDVDYLNSISHWAFKVRERLNIAASSDFRFNLIAANDRPGLTDHLRREDKDAVRTLCSLGTSHRFE